MAAKCGEGTAATTGSAPVRDGYASSASPSSRAWPGVSSRPSAAHCFSSGTGTDTSHRAGESTEVVQQVELRFLGLDRDDEPAVEEAVAPLAAGLGGEQACVA